MMMRRKVDNYAKYGYIFSIPFVVAFLFFSLYPLIYTTVIGFTDLQGLGKSSFSFLSNPFENFQIVLTAPTFQSSVRNTFVIWIINFIPQILLALLLTAWFTSRRYRIRGQGAFKVMLYMPNIITAATIAILFNVLFMHPTGVVNHILQTVGILESSFNFINSMLASQLIIAFIQFWMWYGYTMLILISGVLGMSPDMFEAADIDGASGFQAFFFITLPNLRTILLFTLVTSLIGGLNMFDIPRLFNNGGPDNATTTASVFIFRQAFAGSYMYNRAAAASIVMFVIIALLSAILFYFMRDKEAIRLKKEEKLERQAAREAVK
ncbi:MAG: sugar ABC transporter permease [Oscillospiraceae bacterium]|nr:sugar ABC transporter permease [Oscillospiraceae bacterium]